MDTLLLLSLTVCMVLTLLIHNYRLIRKTDQALDKAIETQSFLRKRITHLEHDLTEKTRGSHE